MDLQYVVNMARFQIILHKKMFIFMLDGVSMAKKQLYEYV